MSWFRTATEIGSEEEAAMFAWDAEPAPWEPDEDVTATINYTSGTTARPKGVQQTHRSLWVNATTFGWQAGVTDRDVYLHTLPMFHCNGWGMPFALAGMGATQVVLRKVDGAEILRRVERHGRALAFKPIQQPFALGKTSDVHNFGADSATVGAFQISNNVAQRSFGFAKR